MSLYNLERMDGLLQDNLRQQVRLVMQRRRGRALRRPPKPQSTKALERRYFKELAGMVDFLKQITNEMLLPEIDGLMREASYLRPTSDSIRFDRHAEILDKIMGNLRVRFMGRFSESTLTEIANRMALNIEKFNSDNVSRAFKSVLGIENSRFEPWLTNELKAFSIQNVKLIRSIPEKYFENVESLVLRGAQAGKLSKDIASEIKNQFGVTESRAALIARDQVSKFNGSLNQLRQQNVGVTKYEWSTSGDERVRPEHAERDGKIFEWSDPPDDGHPGFAINCRCVAIPVFEEES